jgi:uncharacterized protein YgbK (DUF1537 family)
MSSSSDLLLAYYGDDFTGSTDALEFLTRAGIRTALFLAPPTAQQLARYPALQAIGIAGLTRSLAPEAMENELRPAFIALRSLGTPHVHYKVCSTFDSSPTIGSIGRAIDVGVSVFGARFVPLLVGAPALGRHCVFGNLFARMGIGSTGEIHRLDRHPSMSKHPGTPADESDLRLHLAKQTSKRIGLFDILKVELPEPDANAALDTLLAQGAEIVLFDLLYASQLACVGSLIDTHASREHPLFSVGSSGIEMALGAHWAEQKKLQPTCSWANSGHAKPLLVLSGSCSPVTAKQITWATAHGFAGIALDPGELIKESINGGDGTQSRSSSELASIIDLLRSGRHVVVHTSRGDIDPRISPANSSLLGTTLGQIARTAVSETKVRRVLFAGGDSSSYAARALGIEAVEMIAPLAPGAPLCRAHAPGTTIDGLEVNFKGGQVGAEDYFGAVATGHI